MYGKGVLNPSYRQRTMHHAMLLGGMAAITSAILVIANKQTFPDIELRRIEDMQRSLEQVIPAKMHTNDLLKDVVEVKLNNVPKKVHLAKSDDKVVAVAFDTTVKGYAGPIDVIVGISRDGELLGTRVLSHNETPGLGDKIEPEKDSWIFGFNGLSLSNPGESQWKVKKDGGYFDQFTGATITPRAVVKAVKLSLEFYQSNKTVILAETKPQTEVMQDKTQPQDTSKPVSEKDSKSSEQNTVIDKAAAREGKSNG
ncbi:electron transport complex subunit RsxG [Kaarinaea lacus]